MIPWHPSCPCPSPLIAYNKLYNDALLSLTGFSITLTREKSMCLNKDDVIQVKEAFKWIMQGLISKEMGGKPVVTKVSDLAT